MSNPTKCEMQQLKQVVVEYIAQHNGIAPRRIKALIFYTEVNTIAKTSSQLTEGEDKASETIPYEECVTQIIEQLLQANTITKTKSGNLVTNTNPDTTPKQQYLINIYANETTNLSTNEIIKQAKETWVWKSFKANGTAEDIQTFAENYVTPEKVQERKHTLNRNPSNDTTLEDLLAN